MLVVLADTTQFGKLFHIFTSSTTHTKCNEHFNVGQAVVNLCVISGQINWSQSQRYSLTSHSSISSQHLMHVISSCRSSCPPHRSLSFLITRLASDETDSQHHHTRTHALFCLSPVTWYGDGVSKRCWGELWHVVHRIVVVVSSSHLSGITPRLMSSSSS